MNIDTKQWMYMSTKFIKINTCTKLPGKLLYSIEHAVGQLTCK